MKIRAFDTIFLLFLFLLTFRLFFALQTTQFSDDTAYYSARQIENIIENARHAEYDELSHGGRHVLGVPMALYMIAAFKLMLGKYALKIMPAIFISLLVFIVYALANKISGNHTAAALAALSSGFIPILISKTLNNISEYTLVYPLLFLLLYAFYNIESNRYLWLFIGLTFLLPLMHPISFLFAISFVVFFILAYVEDVEASGIRKESILLFVLITFLINFIAYRLAFADIGIEVIWQNIPKAILSDYFKDISIIDMLLNIGLVPLLFGIIGAYFAIKAKNRDVMVLMSVCIASIALLIVKLIDFSTGLVVLGIALSIVSAIGFDKFLKYIAITKLSSHLNTIKISLLIFIVLTLVIPAIFSARDVIGATYRGAEISPFLWIKENTALSATILTNVKEGNLVTGIAGRKSVMDTNFMLVKNINKRFDEANSVFTLESEIKALELIKKYDIDYIYLSEKSKKEYKIKKLKYGMNENCFEKVFENEAGEIIRIVC